MKQLYNHEICPLCKQRASQALGKRSKHDGTWYESRTCGHCEEIYDIECSPHVAQQLNDFMAIRHIFREPILPKPAHIPPRRDFGRINAIAGPLA